MNLPRRRTAIVLGVAALAGAGAGIAVGLGDGAGDPEPSAPALEPLPDQDARPDESPERDPSDSEAEDPPAPPEAEADPAGAEPGPSGPPPGTAPELAATSAARGYVQALDRRAGGAVCRAFVPGALDGFEFPRERSTCAGSVRASLGTARRGGARWNHSRMTSDVSAAIEGDRARVVATVLTTYRGQRDPTIEDDIIHLVRAGGGWQVAKPSLTFHRAMGDPDPPLSALAAP